MQKSLTDSENVGIGIFAAFIEACALQPTLYWKNARAQGLPFTINPRIIYRGTGASLLNEMQMMGVQFGITGYLQRMYWAYRLKGDPGLKKSPAEEIGLATVAGMISAVTTSPVELVMINQQLHGGTIAGHVKSVMSRGGLTAAGLGRGLLPCIYRDGIYVAGLLGVTPTLQNYLMNDRGCSESAAGLYASVVAGTMAAFLSHPLDLVKTCMQGDMEQKRYTSFMKSTRAVVAEGGLSRLYHGVVWRSINIICTVYIANEIRIWSTDYIMKHHR